MKYFKVLLVLGALLLSACGGESSNNNDSDNNSQAGKDLLPSGKTLVVIDTSSPSHYQVTTDDNEVLTDLNETARQSSDSAVQKLEISDGSNLGKFFIWDDGDNGEKIVLLKSGMADDAEITHENLVYIAHYHDEDLAAHSPSEFDPATYGDNWEGSGKQLGLARLNTAFSEQKTLFNEVEEALTAQASEQALCRAFVGSHEEHGEDEGHEEASATKAAAEEEEREEAIHFALTKSGRLYLYEEENEELSSKQSFIALQGVSSISDCDKTAITAVNEETILVFIADTQKVYLVDSHDGADFHEHSNIDISELMPTGFNADLIAAIGEGDEHDHDEDEDDHDDDHDDEDEGE